MESLKVKLIPCLFDNYAYLIHDEVTKMTAVVDPSDRDPILEVLGKMSWKLHYIFNTHHHGDHTGGNSDLKRRTGCQVVASRIDRHRIPEIDIEVSEGDSFSLGKTAIKILDVPGHTKGHIAFWIPEGDALFTGDTLFVMGCGRVFEGTYDEMWLSLDKLRGLPESTKVYCGHEYTVKNALFALTIDPHNEQLKERLKSVQNLQINRCPTVPTTIAEERITNPFLRPESEEIRALLGLQSASCIEVFKAMRQAKDAF